MSREHRAKQQDEAPQPVRDAAESPAPDQEEPVHGVFSTEVMSSVGDGATKKRHKQRIYYFASEEDDGSISLQPVNKHFVPSGRKSAISKDKLFKDYLPEPSMYMQQVVPAMRKLEQAADQGDGHRQKGELFSAEFEYKNALRLDEEHVRSTFGLGLTYLRRGESRNAQVVFERIVTLEAAFEVRHKHLFNEFGIALRKNRLYDQAQAFYQRALGLELEDEHLHFNLARAAYEAGRLREADQRLGQALEINPDFVRASSFQTKVRQAIAAKTITV